MRAPSSPPVVTPHSLDELLARAVALDGRTLEQIAAALGVALGPLGLHGKGTVGGLVERALGATGGSTATWDFPALETELKTVPLGPSGVPRESTYVCTLPLLDAENLEWDSSWVRRKLSRVLFVPVRVSERQVSESRLGAPVLFSPTVEQDAVLRADFDEIVGTIGAGGIEGLTARVGRWMQLRPKAAHGGVRTRAAGPEGSTLETVPRGFYLRATFVGAILRDPRAVP
jgi:DNA mismatch repair protein MutH